MSLSSKSQNAVEAAEGQATALLHKMLPEQRHLILHTLNETQVSRDERDDQDHRDEHDDEYEEDNESDVAYDGGNDDKYDEFEDQVSRKERDYVSREYENRNKSGGGADSQQDLMYDDEQVPHVGDVEAEESFLPTTTPKEST